MERGGKECMCWIPNALQLFLFKIQFNFSFPSLFAVIVIVFVIADFKYKLWENWLDSTQFDSMNKLQNLIYWTNHKT